MVGKSDGFGRIIERSGGAGPRRRPAAHRFARVARMLGAGATINAGMVLGDARSVFGCCLVVPVAAVAPTSTTTPLTTVRAALAGLATAPAIAPLAVGYGLLGLIVVYPRI